MAKKDDKNLNKNTDNTKEQNIEEQNIEKQNPDEQPIENKKTDTLDTLNEILTEMKEEEEPKKEKLKKEKTNTNKSDNKKGKKDKTKKKKSFFGCLGKLILIFIIFIAVLIIGSFVFYLINKKTVNGYIPSNYSVLVKIDSISKTYNNLYNLKVLEELIYQNNLDKISSAYMDFKNKKIFRNKLFASMLDLKLNVILNDKMHPVIVTDLGYKSILFNLATPILKIFAKNDTFFLDKSNDEFGIYRLRIHNIGQDIYFSIENNILLFGMNENDLVSIFNDKKDGNILSNDPSFYTVKNKIKKSAMVKVFFKTDNLLDKLQGSLSMQTKTLLNKFELKDTSCISLDITNTGISFSTYSLANSVDEFLQNIFTQMKPLKNKIIKYLPDNTTIYSLLNFYSFEDIYKLVLYLNDGNYDSLIKIADKACKFLFTVGINDILFSWIGNEVGIYTTGVSTEPVIFVEIKNKKIFTDVKDKITNSIIFEGENEVEYDGMKIQKIAFPDFLVSIVNSFLSKNSFNLDAPFYTVIDNFVFFSMDPAQIANLQKKKKRDELLLFDSDYKTITTKINKKNNMVLYFNMESGIPYYLRSDDNFIKILRHYKKGIFAFNFDSGEFTINFSAVGINEKKVTIFPGYPKKSEYAFASPIIFKNLIGSRVPEMVYLTKNKRLYVTDYNNNTLEGFPVKVDGELKYSPIITDMDNDGEMDIIVFTDDGIFYKYNINGEQKEPYPIETAITGSVEPIVYNGKLIVSSRSEKKVFFIDKEKISEFNFDLKTPLLSRISIRGNMFAFFPKSFEYNIYLTNQNGDIINGWPQSAGKLGYGSPVFTEHGLIFLTKSGLFNYWNFNGKLKQNGFYDAEEGKPIRLNGVFYIQPVVGNIGYNRGKEIITLNENGVLSVFDDSGKLLAQRKVFNNAEKDRKLFLYNVVGDKKKEIVVYGGENNIYIFNEKLYLLSGFPVVGYTKPSFSDLNGDMQMEMVTSSIDNKVYIYTIPK